ncbi:MAG: LysR family transcriptional regulator [Burkholderiales bacterium]|jgi:DNA-binding transcriptional LysR family regulator|nr:LysR family transcriptional regulator [Burkholderiales bacterium]MCA3174055.1 LysR family transcriptional regulator [Burkholderiales bacterium]MCE2984589.1 LysR family transcriptional regulator [Burkholderiales bacterium]
MQLKWLEDFIALAETQSFSKAAVLRHVTHPAFGRRISSLELWCGVALIDRTGYPVELTEAGSVFLDVARDTLRNLQEFKEQAVDNRRDGGHQVLKIATGRTLASTLLPRCLVQARKILPAAEIRISTGSLHDGILALSEGHIDMLVSYFHPRLLVNLNTAEVEYQVVATESLVAVSAVQDGQAVHRLPGSKTHPVPHIRFHTTLAMAKIENEAQKKRGRPCHLMTEIEIDSPEAALDLCLAGLGVAWLPLQLARPALDSGQLIKADPDTPDLPFEIRAYRLRKKSRPIAEWFWEKLPEWAV